MTDNILEIPLPGRTLVASGGVAAGRSSRAAMPSFVAGAENSVVRSVIGELIREDGRPLVTPHLISLHGPSGVGKTHVALGLVAYWRQRCGAAAAEYVTANDFRRAFAEAVRGDAVAEFRNRFRGRQLLAIDDLHQLLANSPIFEELRYTLDDYCDAGGVVLILSNRAPQALPNLPLDVRSRLASGLVLQLAAPSEAARRQILRQAADALGASLSEETVSRLADAATGTANEMFGLLFELLDAASATGDVESAAVERVLSARAARRPMLREIIAVVARYFRVPQKLLKSGSRRHSVVVARATAVYLARELAGTSFEEIGRALGGRDHTTIIHNYRNMQQSRQVDWQARETLDELKRVLTSS